MKNISKLAVLGAVLAASASFAFADTVTLWHSVGGLSGYTTPRHPSRNGARTHVGSPDIPSSGHHRPRAAGTSYCPTGYTGNTATAGTPAVELSPGAVWSGPISNSAWVGINANVNWWSTNGSSNLQYGTCEFQSTFTANGVQRLWRKPWFTPTTRPKSSWIHGTAGTNLLVGSWCDRTDAHPAPTTRRPADCSSGLSGVSSAFRRQRQQHHLHRLSMAAWPDGRDSTILRRYRLQRELVAGTRAQQPDAAWHRPGWCGWMTSSAAA